MLRRWISLSVVCLFSALIFPLEFSAVDSPLRVDESATRVDIDNGKTVVSLAVENTAGRSLAAAIELEWLDPRNISVAEIERSETIKPGASVLRFHLPLVAPPHREEEILWRRLRYRISGYSLPAPVAGVISLSQITPEIFELRVLAADYPYPGKPYRAHIRAVHPITSQPVRGVRVSARLKFDNDRRDEFKAGGATDASGYAVIDFDLPRSLDASGGKLEVAGARGEFEQKVEEELPDDHLGFTDLMLTTDKAIYQPGQILHTRILAFDHVRRAIADANLTLEVTDPESVAQFRSPAKTSRFGVASIDWQIPENARLGDYTISVRLDDDEAFSERELRVRISRYELPNFAVKARADRAYYLPGQNAEVEISADYLFGRPVTRGRVRVAREIQREWNYRDQKWEIEEEESFEGETDASGRFVARIDLAEAHSEIVESRYSRFDDLTYAAYFTDATTGRTEQRRFDLRVTRDAIHIYVVGDNQAEGLPLQFYLTTSYADGTPASCEVAIGEKVEIASSDGFSEEPLRKIKTNRFGAAKVTGLKLRGRGDEDFDPTLVFAARDSRGLTGRRENKFWMNDRGTIRIETGKTIHREGEPIEIQIVANRPLPSAILSVSQDLQILHSQAVRLRNSRAFVVLPWRKEFKDVLSVNVFSEMNGEEFRSISRSVIYPRDRELRLNASLNRPVYRPGEEARANFRVLSPDGRPVEGALGVAVIDRAVEERARADREFSGRGFYYDYLASYFDGYDKLAGFSVRDLRKLDLSKPLPAGLDIVAEVLLHGDVYWPRLYTGSRYNTDQRAIFSSVIDAALQPVETALKLHYDGTGEYPQDEDSLRRILKAGHKDFDSLLDPWDRPHRAEFSTERDTDVLKINCSGADKKFGTADDFTAMKTGWNYFKPTGAAIDRILNRFIDHEEPVTRDVSAFKEELKRGGLDFDALPDRWGKVFELELTAVGTRFIATVRSGGPNGRFEPRGVWPSDDFTLWTASADYFAKTRARIDRALADYVKANGRFPENENELRAALEESGFPANGLRDAWGNEYYAFFSHRYLYTDRVIVSYSDYIKTAERKTEIVPVTARINFIALRSRGQDGKEGTADDFTAADFSRLAAEQSSRDQKPQSITGGATNSGAAGAISGTVFDPQGAAISGATVEATGKLSGQNYEARSDSNGSFLIRNLPAGRYDVRCEALGFTSLMVTDLTVQSSMTTELKIRLDVGSVSEAVTLSAEGERLQTERSAMTAASAQGLPRNGRNALDLASLTAGAGLSTPRLREHFQETLVWQPSIETDSRGRASVKFRLADNITSWKMKVVGSTVDGEIAVAEKEFLAFQPFFAEHEPPKILTEGDEISLPVVVRNYLNRTQTVAAEIKPESWFTMLGPARKKVEVKAGDAARAVFDFRASASVENVRQRVTAIGTGASDAIEKAVIVRPNGQEITQTASDVFTSAGRLAIDIPEDAIKGTARAELKIYPNLMAHAIEGIEGLLQRPYGCAEQTISSTYPNAMALRYLEGQDERAPEIAARARRYLQRGYERLLGYRAEGGGFGYWSQSEPDVALTVYALRFLNDAGRFISVDEYVVKQARAWLIKQQQPDGRWIARYRLEAEDTRRSALNTALIARVLAIDAKSEKSAVDALNLALGYLAKRAEEIDEPYLLASCALAAIDANDHQAAAKAAARLRTLAREEAGTNYWNLESNTPFYGWGLTGRIETTALAVKALHLENEISRPGDGRIDDKIAERGLLFLLRNKDRYGVWLSTQATINVLDALISLNEAKDPMTDAGSEAEVFINGSQVATVPLPPAGQLRNPITTDLSRFLKQGNNSIEIRRSGNPARASVQVVETHFIPWSKSSSTRGENFRPGASSALRFAVSYDKPSAKIGEEIVCEVAAERIGYRGYGMLLGEIGLPPGAEVDRASLERAVKESGGDLNHYEVLPDRVVVYLWPRAGGIKFSFAFNLRYGVRAQTAPSVLYDYYNPEARVVVAPVRFVVD
jgi:hypothetical protein